MAEKKGAFGKTAGYILLGLLLLGLGGFGATNFGGTVRNIGSVGEAEIPATDYFRALQNELNALQAQTGQAMTFQQATLLGVPDRVLSQVVVAAALEHEAASLQISVGDERLAEDLLAIQAFQGIDGNFDRDAYRLRLESLGYSEREFEEQLRNESASTLLQGAVLAGVRLPDTYVNTLLAYVGETRRFSWAEVPLERMTTGLPVPSDADLRSFYDENIARYTRPETKQLTYAWITPDMILDTVEVSEESLREAYEERSAEFNLPERRLVERLVFADQASADAALARIVSGEASFEALVTERELALSDTDLGDVTLAELDGAGEAVFGASVGDVVVGPTGLGPALFRVNGILEAQTTSFEDAQPMLRDGLALDRARRVIDSNAQSYDDELAAGLTLEELAEVTDMELGQIGWTGSNGEIIAGYDGFRDLANAVTAEDYPAIESLGDGGVFALRLDSVQEAAPYDFDEIRDRVASDWELVAQEDALLAEAESLQTQLTGGATFDALSLTAQTEEPLSRNAFNPQLPAGALEAVFGLEPGGVTTLRGQGRVFLVQLDEIIAADMEDEGTQQLVAVFQDQAAQQVAQDLFRALASDIQTRAGVEVDRAALNAIHANFP